MKDEEQSDKNPERDQRATTPTPSVNIPLTIFAHDGFTLPDEGKAQIGLLFTHVGREFSIARSGVSRHALSNSK